MNLKRRTFLQTIFGGLMTIPLISKANKQVKRWVINVNGKFRTAYPQKKKRSIGDGVLLMNFDKTKFIRVAIYKPKEPKEPEFLYNESISENYTRNKKQWDIYFEFHKTKSKDETLEV